MLVTGLSCDPLSEVVMSLASSDGLRFTSEAVAGSESDTRGSDPGTCCARALVTISNKTKAHVPTLKVFTLRSFVIDLHSY
jgi:hypothetical protein